MATARRDSEKSTKSPEKGLFYCLNAGFLLLFMSEFADAINLPYNTVNQKIKNGWEIEDVVKTPYKSRKKWSETNED